jgi:hypothetical protein
MGWSLPDQLPGFPPDPQIWGTGDSITSELEVEMSVEVNGLTLYRTNRQCPHCLRSELLFHPQDPNGRAAADVEAFLWCAQCRAATAFEGGQSVVIYGYYPGDLIGVAAG